MSVATVKKTIKSDFGKQEPCCCPATSDWLDRKVVVLHSKEGITLTYEKRPDPSWCLQLFCCYFCSPPPSNEDVFTHYRTYLEERVSPLTLRMSQAIAKIDLEAMQKAHTPLLLKHAQAMAEAVTAWNSSQVLQVIRDCKIYILTKRKPSDLTLSLPLGKPLIQNQPPPIFVQMAKEKVAFSKEILEKSISQLPFTQELKPSALEALVEAVKRKIEATCPAHGNEIVVLPETISEILAEEINHAGHSLKRPPPLEWQWDEKVFFHPPDNILFAIYTWLNTPNSPVSQQASSKETT